MTIQKVIYSCACGLGFFVLYSVLTPDFSPSIVITSLSISLTVLLSYYGGLSTTISGWLAFSASMYVLNRVQPVPYIAATTDEVWLLLCILGSYLLGLHFRRITLQRNHDVEKLRDLLLDYPGTVLIWKANARTFQFLELTSMDKQILGFEMSHWLSELTFWERHLHPEDRETVLKTLEKVSNQPGTIGSFEHRFISAQGDDVWFRTIVHTKSEIPQIYDDFETTPPLLMGVSIDITTTKSLEAQVLAQEKLLDTLKESLGQGIIGVDLSGLILFSNHIAESVFELSQSEMQGKSIYSLLETAIHKMDLKKILGRESELAAAIRSGSTFSSPMGIPLMNNDPSLSISYCAHPLRGTEDELIGSILTFHLSKALRLQFERAYSDKERLAS